MADETSTRVEEVQENMETTTAIYGGENYLRRICECLEDINISIAMLVDAGSAES